MSDTVLIIASASECPQDVRIWGTGGWTSPETREALDWLTLVRLMGWGVTVVGPDDTAAIATAHPRTIVLACQEEEMSADLIALLNAKLAVEPVAIVARAAREPGGGLALLAGACARHDRRAGDVERWIGPGPRRTWRCRRQLDMSVLTVSDGTVTWATLDGTPVIVARRVGRGVMSTIGFHPSAARDSDGAATALLRHLLIWGSELPAAWVDLEETLVLRMDDPGSPERVYHREWTYPPLGEAAWDAIADDLARRDGRLSVGYVSGWVDDGDALRGDLEIAGSRPSPRIAGSVHPSPHVQYSDRAGHSPGTVHDLQAEFRGIQRLRARGLGDVELHGHTHCQGDRRAWAAAPDRYEAQSWFRELGATCADRSTGGDVHPVVLGVAAAARHFGVRPTTLICPGDEWTNQALEVALAQGLDFIGSYYLAIRDNDRFCWATHVCAPYLDEPDASWFDAGLPVVGYFHDRELSTDGVGWMSRCLNRWQAAGARRFLDYRELAAAVARRLHVDVHMGGLRLIVDGRDAPALVRPLRIGVRLPDGWSRAELQVLVDGRELTVPVAVTDDGIGRVIVPVTHEMSLTMARL